MLRKLEFRITTIIFLLIIGYILFLNSIKLVDLGFIAFIPLGLLVLLLIFCIKKVLKIENTKFLNIISIVVLIFNFVFFIYLGYKLRVEYHWDYGEIHKLAISYSNDGFIKFSNLIYLLRYPNNRFITMILSLIFKVAHAIFGVESADNYRMISIFTNAIFINISYILTYILSRKINGDKFAFIVLLFMEIMLPLLSYSAIFYTDTVGLLFFPLILLMYIFYKEKKDYKYLILIGIFSYIGFSIKATIIFALLAILCDIVCSNKFKGAIKNCLIILGTFIFFYIVLNNGMNAFFNIKKDDANRYTFPHTHHVMMMLNKTGGFNADDVYYTEKFPTYEEKKKANIEVIKKRIGERGVGGTLYHLFYTKWVRTWTDGTFASSIYLSRGSIDNNFWTNLIPINSKNYNSYYLYSTILWLIIVVGMITTLSNKDENILLMKMIIIMLAMFLTIWECNPRYVVQVIPIIVVLAASGWYKLFDKKV